VPYNAYYTEIENPAITLSAHFRTLFPLEQTLRTLQPNRAPRPRILCGGRYKMIGLVAGWAEPGAS
jgi:hypothetical protein